MGWKELGEKQSWVDACQCCDGGLEVTAITVVFSNSLLLSFLFLLVITLGLKKPQW